MKSNIIETFEKIKHGQLYPEEAPRPATAKEKENVANTYRRGAVEYRQRTGKQPALPPWLDC